MTDVSYGSPRLDAWRRRTRLGLLALAIGTVPILLLEFVAHRLPFQDRVFVTAINWSVLVVFLIDYLVGLSLSSSKIGYVRGEKLGALIVVASGLALIPAVAFLGSLRLLRLTPVIRAIVAVIRLISVGGISRIEARNTIRRRSLSFAFGVTAMVWVTSAVAFTLVEDVGVNGRISSFFDALWWSAVTITTVGYGDLTPETTIGRMVAVFCMVLGIGVFGVVTAQLAAFLVKDD